MENYDTTFDERFWAMLSYLLTLFTPPLVAPIVIYAAKKDRSRYLAFHALQSLFLQLSIMVISWTVWHLPGPFRIIGLFTWLAQMVFMVVAAVKAYDGEWYQIPVVGEWALRQAKVPESGGGPADSSTSSSNSAGPDEVI